MKFLGITFIVPYIPPTARSESEVAERLDGFIKDIKTIKCDFYGYFLTEDLQLPEYDGYLYPGVAILGQVVG